jgi:hypothetical protein
LVLVIIDPNPADTGVVRPENTADVINLGAGVKSHVGLAGSGHPETDIVSLLNIRQLGEAGAEVS